MKNLIIVMLTLFFINCSNGRFYRKIHQTEVEGNLVCLVETLCRIHTDDEPGAMNLMEIRLDSGLSSLMHGKKWEDLDLSTQNTLRLIKAYKVKYPPKDNQKELQLLLDQIPYDKDKNYCSPAINKALK